MGEKRGADVSVRQGKKTFNREGSRLKERGAVLEGGKY